MIIVHLPPCRYIVLQEFPVFYTYKMYSKFQFINISDVYLPVQCTTQIYCIW